MTKFEISLILGEIKTIETQISYSQKRMRRLEKDLGEGHPAEDQFADIFHSLRELRKDLADTHDIFAEEQRLDDD